MVWACDYFTTQLGLPAEYVSGFKYYSKMNFFVKILESKDQEKKNYFICGTRL
jgi:hypothetical protein